MSALVYGICFTCTNNVKDSQSSADVSQASHVSLTAIIEPDHTFEFQCYYCDSYKANSKDGYEAHVMRKHGQGHPCYPSKADLERLAKSTGKELGDITMA